MDFGRNGFYIDWNDHVRKQQRNCAFTFTQLIPVADVLHFYTSVFSCQTHKIVDMSQLIRFGNTHLHGIHQHCWCFPCVRSVCKLTVSRINILVYRQALELDAKIINLIKKQNKNPSVYLWHCTGNSCGCSENTVVIKTIIQTT